MYIGLVITQKARKQNFIKMYTREFEHRSSVALLIKFFSFNIIIFYKSIVLLNTWKNFNLKIRHAIYELDTNSRYNVELTHNSHIHFTAMQNFTYEVNN